MIEIVNQNNKYLLKKIIQITRQWKMWKIFYNEKIALMIEKIKKTKLSRYNHFDLQKTIVQFF